LATYTPAVRFRTAARPPLRAALLAFLALTLLPSSVSAHLLTGRYDSPLPLAAYLLGAAVVVGLSFAIVLFRSHSESIETLQEQAAPTGEVAVPLWLRRLIRAVGILAYLWIMVQGFVGHAGDADVGSLFLWTYGWVGLPLISAFIGPIWEWFDPFLTIHDASAWVVRRFRLPTMSTVPYPDRLEHWPAVVALVVFVWLELVYTGARAGQPLAIVLLIYTAWTLLMMAQFGRDTWRRQGETFTVWFGLVNRVAPLARVDEHATRLYVRPYGAGLLTGDWRTSDLALVAAATGSILFDGLSQTQIWFDFFGAPPLFAETAQMLLFLGTIALLVFAVARIVGVPAMAAGLVPIALGYLIAHYLTAIIFDGQRILNALSDPLGLGWNIFGTAEFEPNQTWLPSGIIWAIEIVAVVGGHVYGAVMGHRVLVMNAREQAREQAAAASAAAAARGAGQRRAKRRGAPTAAQARASSATPAATESNFRMRQIPLAILMVFLTTLTLWSLGQGLVHQAPPTTPSAIVSAGRPT
jgi:hypothetical protein